MRQIDRRWFQVLAASAFINTSYGTLSYAFSVLVTKDAAGGAFGTATVSLGFSLALLVSGVAALITGTVADLFGSRRLMAAGSVLGAAGLAALALAQERWQFIAVMAVLVGPAMAATFYEPVYVLMNRWFTGPERPRAYGVLTMASGISITIFTPLTDILVDWLGWRGAVAGLALILFVVGVTVPALLLDEGGNQRAPSARGVTSVLRQTVAGLRAGTPRFWAFTVAFFAGNLAFSGYSFHVIAQLESRGFEPSAVAGVVGLAGVLSLPARLLMPSLSARADAAVLLAGCLAALGGAAFLVANADAWWQVWAYILVFGTVFGAVYPLRALLTSERFPGEYFGRLLGTQALFIAVSRAAGPALIGWWAGDSANYGPAFRAAGIVLFLSALALWLTLRRAPRPLRTRRCLPC
ncbi:MAG: MFS transporter [Dehalococcoidia bacterium]